MSRIDIQWNAHSDSAWDGWLKNVPRAPLQQHRGYASVAEISGNDVHRAVVALDENIVALAQVVVHKRLWFRFAFWSYAPVWLMHVGNADKIAIYQQLRATFPESRALHILTEGHAESLLPHANELGLMDNDQAEVMLLEAGCRPVLTGETRVWWHVGLGQDTLEKSLDPKWQASLKKGLDANLTIKTYGKNKQDYLWLLAAEYEQQQQLGYKQLPAGFVPAFAELSGEKQGVLVLEARAGKESIAAVLFLIHNGTAGYHLSWNNHIGREMSATNRLLWESIPKLKKLGVEWCDLGIIDEASAGLAHFKLGTGGLPLRYAGTFMPRLFGLNTPQFVGTSLKPALQDGSS